MEPKLFTLFKNSYVYILTASLRSMANRQSGHIAIDGFLTDFCEEYWYLSHESQGEITEAIKRSEAIRIFLPIDELSGMLDTSIGNNDEMN